MQKLNYTSKGNGLHGCILREKIDIRVQKIFLKMPKTKQDDKKNA